MLMKPIGLLRAETAASSGVTMTFMDTGVQETDGFTMTVAGLSLGSLAADEFYAVCITSRDFAGADPTTVTLDGVSCTEVAATATSGDTQNFIWVTAKNAAVGATGDAVVTYSSGQSRSMRASVVKIKGAASTTPDDTWTSTLNDLTPGVSLNAAANSGAIVLLGDTQAGTQSATNVLGTERVDAPTALIWTYLLTAEIASANATWDPQITLAATHSNGADLAAVWS